MTRTVKNKILGVIALLTAAALWGGSFVTQLLGMKDLTPLAFNSLRFTLGAITLLPLLTLSTGRTKPKNWTRTIVDCFISGGLLFAAISVEQYALNMSSNAGRSGFITALYIIMVPFMGLFLGEKAQWKTFVAPIFSVVGLAMLTLSGPQGSLTVSDGLLLLGAFGFAVQLIVVNRSTINPIHLSIGQLFVAAGLSWLCTLFMGQMPSGSDVLGSLWPVLFSGVLSTGIAYSLQVFGQQHVAAAPSAILMSMESLFSVVFGALFLGERMGLVAYIGCVFMLAGTVISQLPNKNQPDITETEYVEHEPTGREEMMSQ